MAEKSYNEQQKIKYVQDLRNLQEELPSFLREYFRGINNTTSPRTQVGYARDLKTFFNFLLENNSSLKNVSMHDIPFSLLSQLKAVDIEEYIDYIRLYEKDGIDITNGEQSIKRKIVAIRSMYHYYHRNKIIDNNPTLQVDLPKFHKKQIIRMDSDEVNDFLNTAESGEKLTKRQMAYHEKLGTRDVCILTLLLGTGMRVSELVGINLDDVDYINDRIKIVRKGGYEAFVYFGEEARAALLEYMDEREFMETAEGHENALFISSKKQRISVRGVEMLVKKYAQPITGKHITPHKLRSTYGTNLYKETGDIYLVAEVLGHADVNTTRRHYADMEEERKRNAKDVVTLRKKDQ